MNSSDNKRAFGFASAFNRRFAGRLAAHAATAVGLAVSVAVLATSAYAADLCNNTNTGGVLNNPSSHRTPCNLSGQAHITQLITYHWNNGAGARPGTILLFSPNTGNQWGPFPAGGSSGQGGKVNVNWTANVNITVPAGSYQVIDSDPATWSWNSTSGGYGFAIVEGDYTSGGTSGGNMSGGNIFNRNMSGGGMSGGNGRGVAPVAACPSGPSDRGLPIAPLNCPCNYVVGWGTPNVYTTNPGLKNWYPACKPPLQCLGNHPGSSPYGDSTCH